MSGNGADSPTGLEIAVIGMAARLPGAGDLAALWDNLCGGVESISTFSEEELRAAGVAPGLLSDPAYVRAGGVLEGIDLFDAGFFGLSPQEAEILDPQQRLFLECAWHALEDAGHAAEAYPGPVGVYAGAGVNTYLLRHVYPGGEVERRVGTLQLLVGSEKDFLASRVAYKLNLEGPAITVQSACSTSLVAIHLASQALLSGECDMALAGGVAVRTPHRAGYLHQVGGITSPDGHCRGFDAAAAGTVPGNGVGVVVLRRLADALADGDSVRAVIRGSAVNNDGNLKAGYTAPRVDGQAKVIRAALAMAEVDPATISYVEAHGTGTPLGDPVELLALTEAFGGAPRQECALGSIKANVGHLDAAAGVAGFLKAVLALQHRRIPPQINFSRPNPHLDLADGPFHVNTRLADWPARNGSMRRAGVSSFGLGGTNAHVVLEEAPAALPEPGGDWQLLLLSARSPAALERATDDLARHLEQVEPRELPDVAHTLQVGRRAFEHRRMLVCRDPGDAARTLAGREPRRVLSGRVEAAAEGAEVRTVFLLPGLGELSAGLGRDLYQRQPAFRERLDRCAELLAPRVGLDVRDLLIVDADKPAGGGAPRLDLRRMLGVGSSGANAPELGRAAIAHPVLFALEYALAGLWMDWGVRPAALLGYSTGEYVAACLAGTLSLEDALGVVTLRGQLIDELEAGAMLAVPLPAEEVASRLGSGLSVAAVNGPSLSVVAGPREALEALERDLAAGDLACRWLPVERAFHSPWMRPAAKRLVETLRDIRLAPPAIPWLSNVTGDWITAGQATDPEHWAEHLCRPVLFSQGLERLLAEPAVALLEVGPGQMLGTLARQQAGADRTILSSLPAAWDLRPAEELLLESAGRLWLAGARLAWPRLRPGERRRRVPLPTYPFERQRYWLEPRTEAAGETPARGKQPDLADWAYVPSWRQAGAPAPAVTGGHRWLVVLDEAGLGDEIVRQLQDRGEEVAAVAHGSSWRDPGPVDRIVHLGSILPEGARPAGREGFAAAQERGFYSLLALVQALARRSPAASCEILVVSSGLHEVESADVAWPEQAPLLGLCRVVPLELPHLGCRSLDVVPPAPGPVGEAARQRLARQVLEELERPLETAVALRGRRRWVQTCEPLRLEAVSGGFGGSGLRPRGVYLIVGGQTGVGAAVAGHLARHASARLVLVGRTRLPPRRDWESWLAAHGGEDAEGEIGRRLRNLLEIEALGAEVVAVCADVTDRAQIAAAVAAAEERFGALHGVIHAAGTRVFGTVQEIGRAECEAQLRAKVDGLYALAEALGDRPLDFCLAMSSISSVLGVLGQPAYPAAHAFVEAFCRERNCRGSVRWIAVSWDAWAVEGSAAPRLREEETELFMTFAEGLEVLDRILATDGVEHLEQWVISTAHLGSRIERWRGRRAALPPSAAGAAAHARPDLKTPYLAPRNDIEVTLAVIWQDLLGIATVGVHDNLFDLGGDSVVGIQIIGRAARAGLRLTPQQLFERQTVAELAAVAVAGGEARAAQGTVMGEVPLTPIQRWFLEREPAHPDHFNQAVLLETAADLGPARVAAALARVAAHHDALRLRFRRVDGTWRQAHAEPGDDWPCIHADLARLAPGDAAGALASAAAQLQARLRLAEGPLARAAFFGLGLGRPGRLLLALHHLVVDAVSWRILLEDLEQACRGGVGAVRFLPKTTSFQEWARRLEEAVRRGDLAADLALWEESCGEPVPPLPVDFPRANDGNREGSARTVVVSLGASATRDLLGVSRGGRFEVQEVLVAALASTLAGWAGTSRLRIDLEGLGREPIFPDVDLSRTVGWFTSLFPLDLDLPAHDGTHGALRAVRERLRAAPARGLSYGALRYLSDGEDARAALRPSPPPELVFVYLGRLDRALPASSLFRPAAEPCGPLRSPQNVRSHLLEITCAVSGDRLRAEWTYSEDLHRRETIERLAEGFLAALEEAAASSAVAPDTYAPEDFAQARLSQEELDQVIAGFQGRENR